MKYDAFISYRHGELDGLVAEKLHKMLETYRIPRSIAKKIGKKKLERVFRDREELPTSSNLSDSINDALENSSHLLLICSRRTCQSQWVMREVERFGELHGKDRIITLLIDGEPDESFPPGLREREVGGETIFVEPLAADIRAETWAGSIKLLKEEKLRLLAPVLGCAFDDLRRRHRRRRIQRVASIVGAAFAFVLSFGAFSTYQYIQIDREMQLKLENQSYVLAEYSGEALFGGDPELAALLALAALPENLEKPERPYVPAAESALADALGIYDARGGFKPYKTVTLPAAPGTLLLSPGEKLAAALYPYELALISTETGELEAVLPTVDSVLASAAFLSDEALVFAGENGIALYDVARGEALWTGRPATSVAVSGDGSVVAGVYKDESAAYVYSPDGTLLCEPDFGGRTLRSPARDGIINPNDTLFELSENGDFLAVSFSDGSAAIFELPSGEVTELHPPGAAIHYDGGFYGDILAYALVEKEPYYAGLFLFDAAKGAQIAGYESDALHFIPLAGPDGIFFAFQNQLMSVNLATGEVSHVLSAGGGIESFAKSGDCFLVCESGGAYRFAGSGGALVYGSDYDCHFSALGGKFALTGSRDSQTVRILKNSGGAGVELMRYDSFYAFSEAKVNASLSRAVFYSYSGLRLFDLEGAMIAETIFDDPLDVVDTQYDEKSGNVAVIYESALKLYSGLDGSLLLDARGKGGVRSVLYTGYGVSVLDESGRAALYDLSTGGELAALNTDADADCALFIGGGLLTCADGHVFYDGAEIAQGEIIGAGELDVRGDAFAVSDGARGAVFAVSDGKLSELFSIKTGGSAEAWFLGGVVFVSPARGNALAYDAGGGLLREFDEDGYMSEVSLLGGYVVAGYVSSASERYSFLLSGDGLETIARLPGFLGALSDGETLVLDDGAGSLRGVTLLGPGEITAEARLRLGGRELSAGERLRYKAG